MAEPLILFGAYDRHNLGDVLLGHVAAAESAPRPVIFAGLAKRDLSRWGGHAVVPLPELAKSWGERRANLLHVGGELLTCQTYEAAVMLLTPTEAVAVIARYDSNPAARLAWAQQTLGTRARLPYLAAKTLFRNPGRFEYRAVGGADLDRLTPDARAEVLARLGEADRITVRDAATLRHTGGAGIRAELEADPVSRIVQLFGPRIREHGARGEVAEVRATFPSGYLALQFAAEYGDDASLDRLAEHLERQVQSGLILFRAGAAPWHDDLEVYRRLAKRLPEIQVRLFQSINVWEICALIAEADAYCGSSLHGGIIARAFGVPTLPFPLPTRSAKQAAYWGTWP